MTIDVLKSCKPYKNLSEEICVAALNQAKRSTLGSFNTGAVIFNTKTLEIIGKGCSHYADWSTLPTVHAEEHAIKSCHIKRRRNSYSILIVCIGRAGNLTYSSRPCVSCAKRLHKVGIEFVYYPERLNDGEWIINVESPFSLLERVHENRQRMRYAKDMRILDEAHRGVLSVQR